MSLEDPQTVDAKVDAEVKAQESDALQVQVNKLCEINDNNKKNATKEGGRKRRGRKSRKSRKGRKGKKSRKNKRRTKRH
jgi:hypothetical protein